MGIGAASAVRRRCETS